MDTRAMYTILIVDDNENNLFTLRTLLQAHLDADVIEATSGAMALEKVSQHKIDLILLDIQMPELDGFETAKLIRGRKRYQDIPIIFLTAIYKSEEFKEKGLAGGAIDYLTKPIDEGVLINRVKAYLRLLESERTINLQLTKMNEQLQAEIEERKRVEKALQEQSLFLQTLMDTIPNPIFYKDVRGVYLGCNSAFAEYIGVPKQQMIGKTVFDLMSKARAETIHQQDLELFLKSGVQSYESELTHSDGTTRHVVFNKATFNDLDGNLGGLVGVMLDITELKHLNEQLKEASQHKTDFLSSMSHEIRTPLNATIGYVSLALTALKDKLSPEELENLSKAEHSARTLLQLINDVLDFSKIEAGKMDLFMEEIDLTDIIEDVAITAEGLLLGKPVEVKTEIAADLPVIESDHTKVKQMLNNLMSNAIKFTSQGYVTIRTKTIQEGSMVRIEVEDTGGGIPAEKLGNLFESFKQVDSSIKKKFGGTGLGLAITKQFCEMLGGEIGVTSEVGKGATFWFQLPVHAPTTQKLEQPSVSVEQEERASTATPVSQPDVDATYRSVLVVDDDEMNLTLLKDVFEAEGYTVYSSPSGTQALEIAKAKMPDVIIMDLAMPDLDGFEATQLLRQDPVTANAVIIACSALATGDMREQAFASGCNGFIAKPIQPETLLRKVTEIVAMARQHA